MLTLLKTPELQEQEAVKMPAIASYLTKFNDVTSEEVYINESRFPHMLIGGVTGSGKSSWINSIIANLLHEPFIMWGVDCKEGIELTPWKKRLSRLANTPEDATPLINDLYWIVKERSAFLRGIGGKSWSLEWGPRYILFIDEIVEFLSERVERNKDETMTEAAKRARDEKNSRLNDLVSLASISRAAGVTLVLATQNPTVDILPTSVKSNLDLRVCCRVKSAQSYGVILGHGSKDALTETMSTKDIPFDMPGAAYIDWGEDRLRKARAFHYPEKEIERAMTTFNYDRWAQHFGIEDGQL